MHRSAGFPISILPVSAPARLAGKTRRTNARPSRSQSPVDRRLCEKYHAAFGRDM